MSTVEMSLELSNLRAQLGEMRMRYHQRKTPRASAEELAVVDREIREALLKPPSSELQLEVRRLAARLVALDPR